MKTVQEIREEHGQKASALLNRYYEELDALREQRKPEAGGYLDRLSDEQRMTLLRDQKAASADELHRRTVDAYRAEVEKYQEEVRARVGYVKGALFGLSNPEAAGLLSRAATATEEELGAMVDLAEASGNGELAKAALIGADQRGFAELRVRALERAGTEAQALYGEWSDRPPEEVLARQKEQAEEIVRRPSPERLTAPPPVNR
ncbi:MAG: hypothetical protein M3Q49_12070 [Actinomycetota bacterium]|nr:hypothetical protein [Actinomycetota bacterium]